MKKVIQAKAFRESEAKSGPEAAQEAEFGSDTDARLQLVFKTWLESEADAAAIIHAMSYRVTQSSELSSRARNYASRLRLYVARLSALLPAHMRIPYGSVSVQTRDRRAVTPAACERAASVLVGYLMHHVESLPNVNLDFGSALKTGLCERLLRRMADEREQMARWIRASRQHETGPCHASKEEDDEDPEHHPPDPDTKGSETSTSCALYDEPSRARAAAWKGRSQISYAPQQIVRWM